MEKAKKTFPNGFIRERLEAADGDTVHFGDLAVTFQDGHLYVDLDKRCTFDKELAAVVDMGAISVRALER